MDTNRIMRPVLRQNEDWLDRCRLPPTWEARKTHTPTSIRTHTAQNTADLENDKCARRRRRENLRWASRSHSCLAFSRGRACGAPWSLSFSRKSLGAVS